MIDGDGGGDCGAVGADAACGESVAGEHEAGIVVGAPAGAGEAHIGKFVVTRDGIRVRDLTKEKNAEDR
jgi:hypothetical protein